jgi:hypothetical protein
MKRTRRQEVVAYVITYLLSSIILIIPALWNGYPLVYSDTGTYILAFPSHNIPVDRAIGYSIYIQIIGMRVSLWPVIFSQALVLVFLIDLVLKSIISINFKYRLAMLLLIIVVLSTTTGIDNYASQVMPDIWMSIMILSVSLLFLRHTINWPLLFLLFTLFLVAVLSHYSNLLVATILLIISMITAIVFRKKDLINTKSIKIFALGCLLAWLIAPTINLYYGAGFKLSRANWVMITARFIHEGILQDYLKENCNKNEFILCPFKDSIPNDCIDFLWGNSVLYDGDCIKSGWGECWIEKNDAFGKMILSMLKNPKYLKRTVKMAFTSTYSQLLDFDIGLMSPMMENTPPYNGVKTIFSKELKQYTSSRQNKDFIHYKISSKIQRYAVFLSILLIVILCFINYKIDKLNTNHIILLYFLIMGLVLNAFICGSLSLVIDRYQARVIWLVPFTAILFLLQIFAKHQSQKNN